MTTTTHDLATLKEAIGNAPVDSDLRRVYADACEEAGDDAAASKQRAFADLLDLPVNRNLGERITAAVARANGNRRARLVSGGDAGRAIAGAFWKDSKCAYTDGGGVANGYGYAAATSLVLVVIREDGKIVVDGGEAAARKNGGSPANVWPELIQWREGSAILGVRLQQWADAR